jgi:uncharacterized protein (DUF488 family)
MTIGHSTHPIGDFLDMLGTQGVDLLVDVRSIPKSRHNPQYAREALEATLAGAGIGYLHMPELGGLRHPRKDSINSGWKNAGFRGYADYMQTREFEIALAGLLARSTGRHAALMCAEAVPWRCHRSLIADALLVHGVEIFHIIGKHNVQPHRLTSFLRVAGTRLTYPASGG